jgi:hypothetical protein
VFGLHSSASKGRILLVGTGRRTKEVIVHDLPVEVSSNLRFLGIMITADGRFAPWRDEFDKSIYSM